jgi:hypothetical protein
MSSSCKYTTFDNDKRGKHIFIRKSLLNPQHMRVGTHHPHPMKMIFYPLTFLKHDKSPLKQF